MAAEHPSSHMSAARLDKASIEPDFAHSFIEQLAGSMYKELPKEQQYEYLQQPTGNEETQAELHRAIFMFGKALFGEYISAHLIRALNRYAQHNNIIGPLNAPQQNSVKTLCAKVAEQLHCHNNQFTVRDSVEGSEKAIWAQLAKGLSGSSVECRQALNSLLANYKIPGKSSDLER